MNPVELIMVAGTQLTPELPAWLVEIWEWIKLDWLWIIRAMVEICALSVGIYYIFTFYYPGIYIRQ